MSNGKKRLAAGAIAIGLVMTGTPRATAYSPLLKKTAYLTFTASVALPGMSLASGRYIFEFAEPDDAWGVVRVLSADRSQVFYTGFTRIVYRPAGISRSPVSFGEAPAGAPQPITVWWPYGGATGHEFQRRWPACRQNSC